MCPLFLECDLSSVKGRQRRRRRRRRRRSVEDLGRSDRDSITG
jgi:hypothetical protein